ncbi:MAG: hypothetical protein QM778_06155 [Myxococcales bacterium]
MLERRKQWIAAAALPLFSMFASCDETTPEGGSTDSDGGQDAGRDGAVGGHEAGPGDDGGHGQGDGDGDGDDPVPDICDSCGPGLCLPDKTCAECLSDEHCTGAKGHCDTSIHLCVECLKEAHCSGEEPRCDLESQTCVKCLPGPQDNCPVGQYCDGSDFSCKVGCNMYRCASGICEPDGDCSLCVADDECAPGRVCSTRQCIATCGDRGEVCPEGYDCCDTRCAVLERDPDNCKGCNVVCDASQFCGALSCTENTVAHVCDAVKFSFLLDGHATDDARAQDLYIAFGDLCSDETPSQTIEQTNSNALNQETGQPVVGAGELVVVLGGPFGQHIVGYLEGNKLTKSYNKFDGATAWFYGRGAAGEADPAIVTAPYSILDEHHDFFVIETVTDPISRARVLKLYGLDSPGTNAAAWFFTHEVLADPASFGGTHYIYEWTDATMDGPSADDTYSQLLAE